MEHYILPHNPIPASIRVPYACEEPRDDGTYIPYDGGPFLNYPARMGKDWLVSESHDGESRSEARLKQRLYFNTVAEQESFVQAWLFFGLLAAFMRSTYHANDFIKREENGTFVTTEKLLEKMYESWRARGEHATPQERATQLKNAKSCILVAQNVLHGCFEEFDWRIRLSILSVLELFARSINAAYRTAGVVSEMIPAPSMAGLYPTAEAEQDMKAAGWCPSEIHCLSQRFKSTQTLMFLSRLKRLQLGRDHSSCNQGTCICYQINKETYKTRHVDDQCSCDSSSVDIDSVCRILESDSLPVLRVTDLSSDSPKVTVVSSMQDRPYIAISHVWADGLGNPDLNTLPSCQIAAVARLVRDLQEKASLAADPNAEAGHDKKAQAISYDQDTAYIWIDTLCNPLRPEHYNTLSIKRMHEIYSKAGHVLVLDNELRSIKASDISNVEALLRVFTCGWSQRLWTLQEAVLPKRIWIQFNDGAVDLDLLFTKLVMSFGKDLRELCILEEARNLYFSVRKLIHRLPNYDTSSGGQLWWLDNALYHRSVSFADDEPLCLANLLELPASIFDATAKDPDERMKVIWKKLAERNQDIPQMMLMLNYPRLQTPGYRWAPRTLLQVKNSAHEERILYWKDKSLGKLTEDGFEVSYEGIQLTLHRINGELETYKSVLDTTLQMAIAFHVNGELHTIFANDSLNFALSACENYPTHSELFGKKLVVLKTFPILAGKETEPSVWAALLGHIEGVTKDGNPLVRVLCPVKLQKSNRVWDSTFNAIYDINTRVNSERKEEASQTADEMQKISLEPAGTRKQSTNIQFVPEESAPADHQWLRTRVNTGILSSIEYPPLPEVILRNAREVYRERADLEETLSMLYFSQDPKILIKTLAWMAWHSLRYEPKAEATNGAKRWCIS